MITTRGLAVGGLALALVLFLGTRSGALAQTPVPLTPEQDGRLREVRRMIDATTRVYPRAADVEANVASWVTPTRAGAGAVLSGSRLYLAPETLEAPYRDALVAAALAHRILHRGSRATSLAEYERELRQWATDADALAVEILVRINRQPERAAVQAVSQWLLAQHGGAPDRHTPETLCEELRDLEARFPQHRDVIPAVQCGAGGPGVSPVLRSAPALLVLLPQMPSSPPSTDVPAAPQPAPAPPSNVPAAYCTPGHRLRNVYQCP